MKTKLVLISSLALLVVLSSTSIAFAVTGSISLTDPNWTVYNRVTTNGSENTKTSPPDSQTQSLLQFTFPNSGLQLVCSGCSAAPGDTFTSFLLDKISLSLTTTQTISVTFSVSVTTPGTQFVGNPNGYACGTATSVRLFFQSTGSGNPGGVSGGNPGGAFETKYWWSNPIAYPFVPGGTVAPVTLSVPLDGASWSDFYGHSGAADPYASNFNAAIGAIKYIGLSFGSGCFFANGVGVDYNTGSASFQLTDISIA